MPGPTHEREGTALNLFGTRITEISRRHAAPDRQPRPRSAVGDFPARRQKQRKAGFAAVCSSAKSLLFLHIAGQIP
jgi:hypothetical protein